MFSQEIAKTLLSATIEGFADFERRRKELKKEMKRIAREERRAAMKEFMEEKNITIWSIVKAILMIVGVIAIIAVVITAVERFLELRDEYLYGGYDYDEESGDEDEDAEIAGEFEAEA